MSSYNENVLDYNSNIGENNHNFIKNWFLPHHGNNHKAHLIRPLSLFLLSFIFVFLQIFLNFFSITRPSVLGFSSTISPEKVIELTNIERAKIGEGMLKENKLLSEAAKQKGADMFAFNYWAHISPSGRTPWAFFNDVGYKYQYAGENLARDFQDSDSVVRAWMNSPSHKDNIVSTKFQEIGVAVVQGTLQGVETTLVVQLFGAPFGVPAKSTASSKSPAVQEPVVKTVQKPVIVSKEVMTTNTKGLTSVATPLDITKGSVILIVGILLGVFIIDMLSVSHHHTPRFSSKSLAQMMFLLFVLAASLLIKQGAVL